MSGRAAYAARRRDPRRDLALTHDHGVSGVVPPAWTWAVVCRKSFSRLWVGVGSPGLAGPSDVTADSTFMRRVVEAVRRHRTDATHGHANPAQRRPHLIFGEHPTLSFATQPDQ